MEYRIEHDTMGEVRVPAEHFWGAQTERSLENFRIGTETIPREVIHAFAVLKSAAATANHALGKLPEAEAQAITDACRDICGGKYPEEFPLKVWQTGSGTQSNMNMNEVIAHTAMHDHPELKIHPNDHVNMSQSSNDTFPTAMNMAAVLAIHAQLIPAIDTLIATMKRLEEENHAANLMKIANDIRWLANGPRCGLGEISIPENEPGSSIMPGKVNPTQCEAITMIAIQVMGNDSTIGIGASQGNFELNVFMPVLAYNMMQSIRLLSDGMVSFELHCVRGIKAKKEKMDENLRNSLMLVTCLSPVIGYENAAACAHKAFEENTTLKEAVLALGFLSESEYDEAVRPEKMV